MIASDPFAFAFYSQRPPIQFGPYQPTSIPIPNPLSLPAHEGVKPNIDCSNPKDSNLQYVNRLFRDASFAIMPEESPSIHILPHRGVPVEKD